METTISATELALNLSDVLHRVRDQGERFLIEYDGETVASLGPARPPAGITGIELVDRLGQLTLPGDGFADDLEAMQSEQAIISPPEWSS